MVAGKGQCTERGAANADEAAAKKANAEGEIEMKYQAMVEKLSLEEQAWEKVLQEQIGGF